MQKFWAGIFEKIIHPRSVSSSSSVLTERIENVLKDTSRYGQTKAPALLDVIHISYPQINRLDIMYIRAANAIESPATYYSGP